MRYLPLNNNDRKAMLDVIGVESIDDLFDTVPKAARLESLIDLPLKQSEQAVERHMTRLSNKSVSASSIPFFCGAGAYKHHIPATVDHLIQRSEFLTAYTPYQPEISQGTLTTLFEFQTQVAMLTGMEVVVSGLHPHYAAATQTLASTLNIKIDQRDSAMGQDQDVIDHIDDDTACVVVQSPNVFGEIVDLTPIAETTCCPWRDYAARTSRRRYRGRRRARPWRWPELWWATCRSLCLYAKARASNAGPRLW